MQNFSYARPDTVDSALSLMADHQGAAFIAGGTDMLNRIRDGVSAPGLLIDISRLDLAKVSKDKKRLSIGALTTNTAIAENHIVASEFPLLRDALLSGASPQVRNMATAAGNILQSARCPYFRDVMSACNRRDPGSGCSAIGGTSRKLGVLGVSDQCIAVHGSDFAVALAALDGTVQTVRPGGERCSIKVEDLIRLPEDRPDEATMLAPDELILSIDVDRALAGFSSAYVKTRDRASFGYALVSAAVALTLDEGRVAQARIALGGVAPKPWRARGAEAALVGRAPTEDAIAEAAAQAIVGATPTEDNRYKVDLAARVLTRAIKEALA
ncbi:MAG: xanthine dehydrogenase family protein subunit M [Pseudomonadota bacterium]